MKTVLITGFDPFDKEPINPAYEAIKLLPNEISGAKVVKLEIPTVSEKGIAKTIQAIEDHKPDIVINVGQAGGRFGITPEKVAINLNDFRIKDNEGNQPLDCPIRENGEAAYFTKLPVKTIVKAINEAGIPSTLSYTAGTFVCNQVMYGVLHYITENQLPINAGFVHIPFMMEQVVDKPQKPSLSLDCMAKGLEVMIETCLANEDDIEAVSGEIC